MGIAQEVEQAIDFLLNSYITNKSEAVCHALTPIAITGITIHLIVIAFTIFKGESNEPFQYVLWKIFRFSLISGIALVGGQYQSLVVSGTEGLIGALLEIATPFAALGADLVSRGTMGFWPNFGLIIAAGTVSIAEFLMVAIGLGFFLLAKIGLALTLALGPAFLLCAMWPGTEKYTESWIGQVLNYTLLKILIAACILMLTDIASKFASHIQSTPDTVNVIRATTSLLMCCGALAIVMLNLPQLASALSGGSSIAGIGRTIGRACLDVLNKSGDRRPNPTPKPQDSPPRWDGQERQPPPARTPLYRRNTISHIRKK
jgi:type IV secretion system protein VirB6